MATIEEEVIENQDNQELVAELPPINATDQAQKQLNNSSSTLTTPVEPEESSRFAAPKDAPYGSSSIDLSIPENKAAMWEEYNSFRTLPRNSEEKV